jgi:hypothetical protein
MRYPSGGATHGQRFDEACKGSKETEEGDQEAGSGYRFGGQAERQIASFPESTVQMASGWPDAI